MMSPVGSVKSGRFAAIFPSSIRGISRYRLPVHPALFPIIGFLAGSIPFGFFIAKSQGIDIRQHGSGNIGATNVLRVVGKKFGITCFILDVLKGLLPVILIQQLLGDVPQRDAWIVGSGLATILGHNYTPWLGFKGGKGIATSAGVLIALFPIALLVGLVAWLLFFYTTRYVSLASIVAALAIPATEVVRSVMAGEWRIPHLVFSILIGFLAVWRHRSNIKKLMAGEENRFVPKSKRGA